MNRKTYTAQGDLIDVVDGDEMLRNFYLGPFLNLGKYLALTKGNLSLEQGVWISGSAGLGAGETWQTHRRAWGTWLPGNQDPRAGKPARQAQRPTLMAGLRRDVLVTSLEAGGPSDPTFWEPWLRSTRRNGRSAASFCRSALIWLHWRQTDSVEGTIRYRVRRAPSTVPTRCASHPAFTAPCRSSAIVMKETASILPRR